MLLHDYPTPAQTTIFVGDNFLDDAYSVNFEVQHPRVPLYGYNQSFYSQMADGKVLVTGTLIINYRYPGYLAEAIKRYQDFARTRQMAEDIIGSHLGGFPTAGLSDPHPIGVIDLTSRRLNRDKLRVKLKDLRSTDDPNERTRIIARSMVNGTFRDVSQLSRLLFSEDLAETTRENPAQIPAREGNFDIQIAFGDGAGPLRVDILRACHITGMAKSMSSSAHGHAGSVSGAPIFEVYPFVAKRLDQWMIDLKNGQANEYARAYPKSTRTTVPVKRVNDYL